MIQRIQKGLIPAIELTPSMYNKYTEVRRTYYFLIPGSIVENTYIVYWPVRTGTYVGLTSSSNGRIEYQDIPFKDTLVLSYDEIRDIHINSQYVYTSSLGKYLKESILCGLGDLK